MKVSHSAAILLFLGLVYALLLDVGMPLLDGFGLIRKIRENKQLQTSDFRTLMSKA